ncbi:MAG: serine/threonine protein kinase [Bradymonadia bacterium]|jgi:serine/threonine protein kinase
MLEHRYTDLQPLRSNAVGEVSSAFHRVLGRPVHVCVIDPELREETRAALDARVKCVSTLTHPHILAIVDADFDASPAFFVTEAVRPQSLLAVLHEQEIGRGRALRMISELLDAVHCAHSHDVVHGGLSPARVFFDAVGSLRLGDFGFGAARTDARAGTVAIDTDAMPYLPIRVLRNPEAYDASADLHCAAAIGFHLLTGSAPETGSPSEVKGVPQGVVDGLSALMRDGSGMAELDRAIASFCGVAGIETHRDVPATATLPTSATPDSAPSDAGTGQADELLTEHEDGNEELTTEALIEHAPHNPEDEAPAAGATRDAETAQHPTSHESQVPLDETARAEDTISDSSLDDDATSETPAEEDERATARGLSPARASGSSVAMTGPVPKRGNPLEAAIPGVLTSATHTVAGIPVGNGSTLLEPSAALLEQVAALSVKKSPIDDVSSLDITDADVQSNGPHVTAEDDSDGVATFGDAAADIITDSSASATPLEPPPAPVAAGSARTAAKEAADRVAGKLNKYAHLLGQ